MSQLQSMGAGGPVAGERERQLLSPGSVSPGTAPSSVFIQQRLAEAQLASAKLHTEPWVQGRSEGRDQAHTVRTQRAKAGPSSFSELP